MSAIGVHIRIGSHVLEMGKHFEDYARYDWEGPSFTTIAGFPTGPTMQQLKTKARSPGVTGNIGESVAGIVAVQILNCDSKDIAHLVVKSKQKTPDFLIRDSAGVRSLLTSVMPGLSDKRTPPWWPLESKIRSIGLDNTVVKEGLWQLASVWYRMKNSAPLDVGYGVVVCVGLQDPREIRIHFFLPEDSPKQQTLLNRLNSFPKYSAFVKSDIEEFAKYLLKYD